MIDALKYRTNIDHWWKKYLWHSKLQPGIICVFGCFVPHDHEWSRYVPITALFTEEGHQVA